MSCITARSETVPWLLWTWLMAALGKHTRNISKAGKRVKQRERETQRRKCRLAQPGSGLPPQTRILKNLKTKGRKRRLWTNPCTALCLSPVSGLWPSPCARASVLTHELKQRLPWRKSKTLILGSRIYHSGFQQANIKPSEQISDSGYFTYCQTVQAPKSLTHLSSPPTSEVGKGCSFYRAVLRNQGIRFLDLNSPLDSTCHLYYTLAGDLQRCFAMRNLRSEDLAQI